MNFIRPLTKYPENLICAVGLFNLANFFAYGLYPNSWLMISFFVLLILLAGAAASLFILVLSWSAKNSERAKRAFLRLTLCLGFFALSFLALHVGGYVRLQMFLAELPHYQTMIDDFVAKNKGHFPMAERTKPGGSADWDAEAVDIGADKYGVVTVDLLTNSYGFPARHQGYIYRSNDDLAGLKAQLQYHNTDFIPVAPHWYRWVD